MDRRIEQNAVSYPRICDQSGRIFTNPTLIELRQEIGHYDWLASPRADDVVLCSRMEIITKQAIECGLGISLGLRSSHWGLRKQFDSHAKTPQKRSYGRSSICSFPGYGRSSSPENHPSLPTPSPVQAPGVRAETIGPRNDGWRHFRVIISPNDQVPSSSVTDLFFLLRR
ncbi:hypothetical protein AVEN_125309-1 [Araneus ventricosus]|uniref:Uncharacterized protein n=1 Tax=Araneus ventricosus TaxID=182803 RepID=A0A4Y2Q9X7_ARAVE|nr:hypothetical protein AVEN_125309-1 [Araneus ventricosus]